MRRSGFVPEGGASSRMGRDEPLLDWNLTVACDRPGITAVTLRGLIDLEAAQAI